MSDLLLLAPFVEIYKDWSSPEELANAFLQACLSSPDADIASKAAAVIENKDEAIDPSRVHQLIQYTQHMIRELSNDDLLDGSQTTRGLEEDLGKVQEIVVSSSTSFDPSYIPAGDPSDTFRILLLMMATCHIITRAFKKSDRGVFYEIVRVLYALNMLMSDVIIKASKYNKDLSSVKRARTWAFTAEGISNQVRRKALDLRSEEKERRTRLKDGWGRRIAWVHQKNPRVPITRIREEPRTLSNSGTIDDLSRDDSLYPRRTSLAEFLKDGRQEDGSVFLYKGISSLQTFITTADFDIFSNPGGSAFGAGLYVSTSQSVAAEYVGIDGDGALLKFRISAEDAEQYVGDIDRYEESHKRVGPDNRVIDSVRMCQPESALQDNTSTCRVPTIQEGISWYAPCSHKSDYCETYMVIVDPELANRMQVAEIIKIVQSE